MVNLIVIQSPKKLTNTQTCTCHFISVHNNDIDDDKDNQIQTKKDK